MTGTKSKRPTSAGREAALARNIALKLEYYGRDFEGWQIQARGRTVQGVIKENLERFLRHEVKLIGAGRTDAGVHALGQFANFRTSSTLATRDIKHKLNQMLPDDIVVLKCLERPAIFDARRSAIWREYRYLISERPTAVNRPVSWTIGRKLDLGLLSQMAEIVKRGEYFGNFCKTKSLKDNDSCRIISAVWERQRGFLQFEITANRFLHNMVRLLVGTMIACLDGKLTLSRFTDMIINKMSEKAKYIAPACGLFLADVGYERGIG